MYRRACSRLSCAPLGILAVALFVLLAMSAPWLAAHQDRAVQIARGAGAVLLVAAGWAIAALAVHLTSPARRVRREPWGGEVDLEPLPPRARPVLRAVPETAPPVTLAPVVYPGKRPEPVPVADPEQAEVTA